jgi:formylglycine-generating enzyme required for sulfatase activity
MSTTIGSKPEAPDNVDAGSSCCVLSQTAGNGKHPGSHSIRATATRARDGIVEIPGGDAIVGTDAPVYRGDGEGPARCVALRPFRLDACAVTNERFAAFVAATGYRSDAERYGWSFVFRGLLLPHVAGERLPGAPWWIKVDGAYWSAPEGPGSTISQRLDHPVTHASWNDAVAFATWTGGRLPTEVEWEHAAKAGSATARFPWGDEEPNDETAHLCNIWQGNFPFVNTAADGFVGTAPANSFPPNHFGLYNMSGNVWEWCVDQFRVRSLTAAAKVRNRDAASNQEHTMKGGSFLCHRNSCYRYRVAARIGQSPDTSASNTGFRVAYRSYRQ